MLLNLDEAADQLNHGKVVAIPTETVYGLAARFDLPQAVQKVFELKKRPVNNPLILHISDVKELQRFTNDLPPHTEKLAATFWPGPLTLVMPIKPETIPEAIRSGLNAQAFRIPNHSITAELLKKTGPLVAPSANLSGRPSSVSPKHVEQDFGKEIGILDGGICSKGVESTILVFSEGKWHLGRLGSIAPETLQPILGYMPTQIISGKPLCPGQLYRHYAPRAKLKLSTDFADATVILGFPDRIYPTSACVINLGTSPESVLKNLYTNLRLLDEENIHEAYIDIDVPQTGLWNTFLERVKKASS